MFFWSCLSLALLGWLVVGSIVVLFVYAAHWAVLVLALLALFLLLRNIGARAR